MSKQSGISGKCHVWQTRHVGIYLLVCYPGTGSVRSGHSSNTSRSDQWVSTRSSLHSKGSRRSSTLAAMGVADASDSNGESDSDQDSKDGDEEGEQDVANSGKKTKKVNFI